jgi:cell division topological specificity factor
MLNEWIAKYFNRGNSKDVAKKRLQFAIIYDKLDISEEILGALQQDMVDMITRYFVIDKESLKIDIRREEDMSALVVNIPILKAVRKKQQTALVMTSKAHKGR